VLYDFTEPLEHSEVGLREVFGVLKLTLEDGGYAPGPRDVSLTVPAR